MTENDRIAQYELIELLGEHVDGSTHRVRAESGDADLVLKRVRSSMGDAPEEAARKRHDLIADARRWTQQGPAGVLPIVDAGEIADGVFIVTPWRSEPTLERLVPLLCNDPESALYVLRSVATILDRLHCAGSVHRSLKTTNVLVQDDGDVLFTDVLHLASCSAALMGSEPPPERALVAAPEQVMGFRQTPASNRYVFASIAYRLLTGSPVFPQEDVVEFLYATVYNVPPPASEVHGELPETFDRLLAWGLDKEPSSRPRTCVELVDALAEALATARAYDVGEARSAVAEELPWDSSPAPSAMSAPDAEERVSEPAAIDVSGRQLMAALREAWERPRPVGGPRSRPDTPEIADDIVEVSAAGAAIRHEAPRLVEELPEPATASEEPIEAGSASRRKGDDAAGLAHEAADVEVPRLRLLKPIAARAPSAAPAIGAAGAPIRYGRDEQRSRSRASRWLSVRKRWMSRLSSSGAPPRDLEERESYLADWRKGIASASKERGGEPMLPTWPLRIDGCRLGSRLFADGQPVASVPGTVQLRGRSGTVLQLEVRRDGDIVGRREIRLHPLMDASWDLGGEDLSTEA